MKLIDDLSFGLLVEVYLKAKKWFLETDESFEIEVRRDSDFLNSRALHALVSFARRTPNFDSLFSKNTFLGPHTASALSNMVMDLKRKGDGSLVGGAVNHEGFQELRRQHEYWKRVNGIISRKYTIATKLDRQDQVTLEQQQQISRTLKDEITVSRAEYERLKDFLESYVDLYRQKELEGQELWGVPEYEARDTINYINTESTIERFGMHRVPYFCDAVANTLFCHSMFYLHKTGMIELLSLEEGYPLRNGTGSYATPLLWKAVFNIIKAHRADLTEEKGSLLPQGVVSLKKRVAELLRQYKFSRLQKKLIMKLVSGLPIETKILTEKIGTKDLPSLKRDVLNKIRDKGLENIFDIESKKTGADKYSYQLKIDLPRQ